MMIWVFLPYGFFTNGSINKSSINCILVQEHEQIRYITPQQEELCYWLQFYIFCGVICLLLISIFMKLLSKRKNKVGSAQGEDKNHVI